MIFKKRQKNILRVNSVRRFSESGFILTIRHFCFKLTRNTNKFDDTRYAGIRVNRDIEFTRNVNI